MQVGVRSSPMQLSSCRHHLFLLKTLPHFPVDRHTMSAQRGEGRNSFRVLLPLLTRFPADGLCIMRVAATD